MKMKTLFAILDNLYFILTFLLFTPVAFGMLHQMLFGKMTTERPILCIYDDFFIWKPSHLMK